MKIDKIAKSFNTPNNKVESIAKWIELSSGNDSDVKKKAVHLLSRYVKLYIVPKAKWKG